MTTAGLRNAIDWGELGPLRLRAREVAEGLYAGLHRSALRGAGVEFGGFREYLPGDDLRWLDRRALLLHDRLVIRQFETETDRSVCLLVDASASMAYRGAGAAGSKFAFAAVVAAALARVALVRGDPASLTLVGGTSGLGPVPRASGREQFERIVDALEGTQAHGDVTGDPTMLDRALQVASRGTRRGAIFLLASDLLDWPDEAIDRVAALAAGGRVLGVLQVLDRTEASFPFEGTVRLRALEGDAVVETDASSARTGYLGALSELTSRWRDGIRRRGGRFFAATTHEAPAAVVRRIVEGIR